MGAGPRFTPPGKHLVDANAGPVTEWGQVGASPWENIMEQGEGPKYSVWGGKLVWRGKGLDRMESRRGPEKGPGWRRAGCGARAMGLTGCRPVPHQRRPRPAKVGEDCLFR